MMLKDLLLSSRSYRSFDESVKITNEMLATWVDHTRYAPSSINLQMLKFYTVTDASLCQRMLANTRWAGKIKDMKLPPEGHAPVAYVVICADKGVVPTAETFEKDVGICAQTIMLAASEDGFGGCMLGSFTSDAVKELLELDENLVPKLVLALGKPDERVELVGEAPDGSVTYYREGGIHHVQKRKLENILIQK
ncbi:MAG: nitroreductase family protein [Clostridia bacterium]|nr:nitroreductase family protein [Clostridia bacterium]